jgi:hypothetical protein
MSIILLVYVSFRFSFASGRVGSDRFASDRVRLPILIPEKHSQELLVWKLGVPRFNVAINLLDLARGGE